MSRLIFVRERITRGEKSFYLILRTAANFACIWMLRRKCMFVSEKFLTTAILGFSLAEYWHSTVHLSLEGGNKLHRYFTPMRLIIYILRTSSGFGGLEVACWPVVFKFAGSNPTEAVGFFSTPSFGGEVKPSVPCRRFTACKRSLNIMWKSGIFRQNSSAISRPCSSASGR